MPFSGKAHDLLVVFEDYPPYEYVEHSEVKGINIDLAREAFRRMGVTPSFEPRPWKRGLYQLKTGEILALSSGFKTPEREKIAIFPDSPLAAETNVVLALKNSRKSIKSLDELHSLRIGVVRDYAYGKEFDDMVGLKKIFAKSMTQLIDMLQNKRVDVILASQEVSQHLLKKSGELDDVEVLYTLSREPLYLFFSRIHGPESQKLADQFSAAVQSMKEDGTFAAIKARY
ncbi:amino acid ABC transporter substrate-binding protein [Pseudodesulfovibrio sediminis]|uniref:Amino acid ABC transporter substrate-binding protein n=1 Tax=Pseudodesulfovibrio sediminis TaxID=2810563 RepID=A0ABN6EQF2_9BACT|nr:amino acid ABC transporter substrate-binding protein [Pseudodesulfovibrio sediminis]